jgi:hypothetical protein
VSKPVYVRQPLNLRPTFFSYCARACLLHVSFRALPQLLWCIIYRRATLPRRFGLIGFDSIVGREYNVMLGVREGDIGDVKVILGGRERIVLAHFLFQASQEERSPGTDLLSNDSDVGCCTRLPELPRD